MLTATLQRRLTPEGEERDSGIIRAFTWRNALLGGVAAFVSLALATALSMGVRTWLGDAGRLGQAAADENSLVVLPFTFQGDSEHAYLGEGIVDLLSTKLDGAGELRSCAEAAPYDPSGCHRTHLPTPRAPNEEVGAPRSFSITLCRVRTRPRRRLFLMANPVSASTFICPAGTSPSPDLAAIRRAASRV